jgi:NAD(P)H-flavin reductase
VYVEAQVHYTLDSPPVGWTGGVGFVDDAMMAEHLPAPAGETLLLVAGPKGMVNACQASALRLGYKELYKGSTSAAYMSPDCTCVSTEKLKEKSVLWD